MINLIPPTVRQQIRYGRLNVLVVQYFIGMLIISLMLAGLIYLGVILIGNKKVNLEEQLAIASTEFAGYSDTIAEATELSNTINTIKSLLDREFKFSEVLEKMTSIIPDGATLDAISLSNQEDQLELSVTLDDRDLAGVFIKNMTETGLFASADLQSLVSGDDQNYRGTFTVIFSSEETPVIPVPEASEENTPEVDNSEATP